MKPSMPLFAASLLLALAACDAPPDVDDAADTVQVEDADAVGDGQAPRWDGLGPATFGMTADEVRAAWDGDLVGNPVEEAGCFHLNPTAQPGYAPFALMFGDGRFVRYSVSADATTAPGGGRRGMADTEIEAQYPGAVERQPHKYTDGEYLRIRGQGEQVLVFETDGGGIVTAWRVGVPPYVDYVEGCS